MRAENHVIDANRQLQNNRSSVEGQRIGRLMFILFEWYNYFYLNCIKLFIYLNEGRVTGDAPRFKSSLVESWKKWPSHPRASIWNRGSTEPFLEFFEIENLKFQKWVKYSTVGCK
jgi:hypothetical protein